MKSIKLLAFLILLVTNYFLINAQTNQKDIKTIYPDLKFDESLASNALEKGTATIKGVLFTREKNGYGIKRGPKIYAANVIVNLFPVTPYLDSWFELRRKKESKRTKVEMSNEAAKKCLETKTDDDGNFVFSKLKPGRYFLQSFIHSEYDYYKTVDTGQRDVNSAGDVTAYTKNVYYTNDQDERIEKFIDVKPNVEIIEIKLK